MKVICNRQRNKMVFAISILISCIPALAFAAQVNVKNTFISYPSAKTEPNRQQNFKVQQYQPVQLCAVEQKQVQAKKEAERQAKLKARNELKAKREAERKAAKEAKLKARKAAEVKAAAEAKAKAEAKVKREAERKAAKVAKVKAHNELKAKRQAERKAAVVKAELERKAAQAAKVKAHKAAEVKAAAEAKAKAEAKVKREAERKAAKAAKLKARKAAVAKAELERKATAELRLRTRTEAKQKELAESIVKLKVETNELGKKESQRIAQVTAAAKLEAKKKAEREAKLKAKAVAKQKKLAKAIESAKEPKDKAKLRQKAETLKKQEDQRIAQATAAAKVEADKKAANEAALKAKAEAKQKKTAATITKLEKESQALQQSEAKRIAQVPAEVKQTIQRNKAAAAAEVKAKAEAKVKREAERKAAKAANLKARKAAVAKAELERKATAELRLRTRTEAKQKELAESIVKLKVETNELGKKESQRTARAAAAATLEAKKKAEREAKLKAKAVAKQKKLAKAIESTKEPKEKAKLRQKAETLKKQETQRIAQATAAAKLEAGKKAANESALKAKAAAKQKKTAASITKLEKESQALQQSEAKRIAQVPAEVKQTIERKKAAAEIKPVKWKTVEQRIAALRGKLKGKEIPAVKPTKARPAAMPAVKPEERAKWRVSLGAIHREIKSQSFKAGSYSAHYPIAPKARDKTYTYSSAGDLDSIAERDYENGYVYMDEWTDLDSGTWYWGYDYASQVEADNTISFRWLASSVTEYKRETSATTEQIKDELDNDQGLYLQAERVLTQNDWMDCGLHLDCSLLSFSSGGSLCTFRDLQNWATYYSYGYDTYSLADTGITPQSEPYHGTEQDSGPTIDNIPSSRKSTGLIKVASRSYEAYNIIDESLDIDLSTISFGLFLSANYQEFYLSGVAGPTLNVVEKDASYNEKLYARSNGGVPSVLMEWSDTQDNTECVVGFFVQGQLGIRIIDYLELSLFGRYDWIENITDDIGQSRYVVNPEGPSIGGTLNFTF